MSDKDLNNPYFEETFLASISSQESAANLLMARYRGLRKEEAEEIVDLFNTDRANHDKEKVELVATAPGAFTMKVKETDTVVCKLFRGARKKIILTGYSISSYFDNMIDILINKKDSGVFVKIFLDKNENNKGARKLIENRGRFLEVYSYERSKDDPMSALHAKIISVDDRYSLITSANLSYHGQEGNIELGTLVTSEEIAHKIDDVLKKLIFKKVFRRID